MVFIYGVFFLFFKDCPLGHFSTGPTLAIFVPVLGTPKMARSIHGFEVIFKWLCILCPFCMITL